VAPLVDVELPFGAPNSSGRFTGSRVKTHREHSTAVAHGTKVRARNNLAHPCSGTPNARRALRPTRLNWIATVNDERTYKKVWSRCELLPSIYFYN
jgi:hypothetical protein